MLILGKAANLDVGYSPNLGAILLLHLAHQANHAQGDIVCGGVITMLANSLGLNYNHLCPIVGNTLVNIHVLTSAGMVVVRNGRHCIRIPGVAHLLPTPMPNRFSIEHGQLHYVAQEGDAAFDQEGPEPKQVDEEEFATDEEEEQPQEQPQQEAYTTYADLNNFQGSIDDMSNHASSLRSMSAYMNMNFSNWSQEWAPDQPPQ